FPIDASGLPTLAPYQPPCSLGCMRWLGGNPPGRLPLERHSPLVISQVQPRRPSGLLASSVVVAVGYRERMTQAVLKISSPSPSIGAGVRPSNRAFSTRQPREPTISERT